MALALAAPVPTLLAVAVAVAVPPVPLLVPVPPMPPVAVALAVAALAASSLVAVAVDVALPPLPPAALLSVLAPPLPPVEVALAETAPVAAPPPAVEFAVAHAAVAAGAAGRAGAAVAAVGDREGTGAVAGDDVGGRAVAAVAAGAVIAAVAALGESQARGRGDERRADAIAVDARPAIAAELAFGVHHAVSEAGQRRGVIGAGDRVARHVDVAAVARVVHSGEREVAADPARGRGDDVIAAGGWRNAAGQQSERAVERARARDRELAGRAACDIGLQCASGILGIVTVYDHHVGPGEE